jgi:hypothetical protein
MTFASMGGRTATDGLQEITPPQRQLADLFGCTQKRTVAAFSASALRLQLFDEDHY